MTNTLNSFKNKLNSTKDNLLKKTKKKLNSYKDTIDSIGDDLLDSAEEILLDSAEEELTAAKKKLKSKKHNLLNSFNGSLNPDQVIEHPYVYKFFGLKPFTWFIIVIILNVIIIVLLISESVKLKKIYDRATVYGNAAN